ncbi:hypothetical protein HH213_17300 [Duganella dendranthematis]|uniref:Uncharacterized protein n=1 Tax=Duganella dendranthematis TaxID=2728021 RepID=A0ABX6MBH8_9BURK|nr:hypothetical protein [Duganella dendranthematis]QJD91688.1 hypothetical protein HH213_17300 [Duganella dendranthematis]
MKESSNYSERFLEIVSTAPTYEPGTAEALLVQIVSDYAYDEDLAYEDAALTLSRLPRYDGGFGVNIWVEDDGAKTTEFTASDDCTWMDLESVVEAVAKGVEAWFDDDWVRKR